MKAPLYQGAAEAAAQAFQPKAGPSGPAWGGNAGLWYDKFCDRWQPDFAGLADENSKLRWVQSVIHPRGRDGVPDAAKPPVRTGDAALLAEHARRRRTLVNARGGRVVEMRLETRFATGLGRRHPVENGFAWHHSLGVPYLAGAGVKGLIRAWAQSEALAGMDTIFGPRPDARALRVGSIILLDALPVQPLQLVAEVMTPHTGPWNLADPDNVASLEPPADWHSPNPIPFLAVEAGTVFQFAVLPRVPSAPIETVSIKDVEDWLVEALSWLGAGAKTATGFGRFRPADAPQPNDPDPVFPFTTTPPAAPATGGRPSMRAATLQRAFVDGEPVEIIRREGGRVVVRFVNSGDIETVGTDEVE